jgi:hypothetical protein
VYCVTWTFRPPSRENIHSRLFYQRLLQVLHAIKPYTDDQAAHRAKRRKLLDLMVQHKVREAEQPKVRENGHKNNDEIIVPTVIVTEGTLNYVLF